jgi:hypothetical protein
MHVACTFVCMQHCFTALRVATQAFHAVDGQPPPSSLGPAFLKIGAALICLAVHVALASRYPVSLVLTSAFKHAPFLHKCASP